MMNIPSSEMIMRWLQQARIEHYVCDQCHGIHMVSLQSVEGIQESRIPVVSLLFDRPCAYTQPFS